MFHDTQCEYDSIIFFCSEILSIASHQWPLVWDSTHPNSGSAHYLEDTRKQDLQDLAEILTSEYPQYGRACRYLQMLGGLVARPVERLPEIQFLLAGGNPPLQRGSATLENPEPYDVHRLNVKFHRYN